MTVHPLLEEPRYLAEPTQFFPQLVEHPQAWQLLIVDLFLRSGSGLHLVEDLPPRGPHQKVVVFSNYVNATVRKRCAQLGVDAVFDKSTELDALVDSELKPLKLEGAHFSTQVESDAANAGPEGIDRVEFWVQTNPGTRPGPLMKVASGGELARISLAISVIASSATATPTLIFDEVDSGIGGGVAEVVGRLLKKLGQDRQVLCVTHLPQVASQAAQHFQVSKGATPQGRTVSRITPLSSAERVEEIARMLGGLEITATTRKHARELLAS